MRQKVILPFVIILGVLVLALNFSGLPSQMDLAINSGDTAWMLTSTAFVLLMTPGLAFFYGGMVRKKNVLSTMLQSFICMGLITVLWVICGFSIFYGESVGGFFGNPITYFMMEGITGKVSGTIPLVVFAFFQLKFAIITPALITGAFAERIRFTAYLVFILLFSLVIYSPLAHMTWHPDGILFKMGILDFAGGTVVHMSAGWAALASALYLKSRSTNGDGETEPARISYVIIGTGLLWFGWMGFNGGSALAANHVAANAIAVSSVAAAVASLTWVFFDLFLGKKPSTMGACIACIVGLVAITPASGYVTISHSIVIGIVSAIVSNLVVTYRTKKTKIDDTLDVFPCHGVGGMVGMILTGIFATTTVNAAGNNGLFFGNVNLFINQVIALIAVSIFTFLGSWILLVITNKIIPLRVSKEEEEIGLDLSQHGERL